MNVMGFTQWTIDKSTSNVESRDLDESVYIFIALQYSMLHTARPIARLSSRAASCAQVRKPFILAATYSTMSSKPSNMIRKSLMTSEDD